MSTETGTRSHGQSSTPPSGQPLDPNIPDTIGLRPLHRAVLNNDIEETKLLLLQKDLDPNIQDEQGKTPLALAAQKGFHEIAKHLLSREDIVPDLRDRSGRTPLIWALTEGNSTEIALLLLARKDVDINAVDGGRANDEGY